jgi:LCP family protein required for cell wall assembly
MDNLNSFTPEEGPHLAEQTKKTRPVLFWIFVAISVIIAIFLLRSIAKSDETEYSSTLIPRKAGFFQTVKNFFFKSDEVLIGQNEDRVNILLLGIGGPGHDGPYLSDTNIIFSLKPSTNEVALISIPRDLGVKVDGHGWRKINSADAFGEAEQPGLGGEYARKIFEESFNQKIPYFIRVDFTAFSEIIDSVGGITVNVPTAFTDSAYPAENFAFQTVSFQKGEQQMNGDTALKYARSRHGNNGEGSDFARAKRQQMILEALKQKVLSLGTFANPNKLQEIYSSLSHHVSTNLNFAQMAYLASLASDLSGSKRLVLDSAPGGFLINTTGENGAFMLAPKTGSFNSINDAISNIFSQTSIATTNPTPIVYQNSTSTSAPTTQLNMGTSSPRIEIENGTWIPGLAARMQKKLQDKGFTVIMVGNSLKRPIEKTVIYILNDRVNRASIEELSKGLKAANTTNIPEWLSDTYDDPMTVEDETGMKYNKDADVLIILGTDTKE